MVAAQLCAAEALAAIDGQRVRLRPIGADVGVAHAVKAVRLEAGGEEVVGPGRVEEVEFDDAVGIARAAGVQAHLEVLVVDLDVLKGELEVVEDTDAPLCGPCILDDDIPELDVVVHWNEHSSCSAWIPA